jgi:energy-converting hydrogenase A subunit R
MICFDLEGPLSPQDNAYEIMRLAENGGKVFEALSEYDDILALRGKEGYEPGDTLKLAVPFLIYYGITEDDVRRVSQRARLVTGMKETVDWIKKKEVLVRVISTSYEQHAYNVGGQLGLSEEEIACTKLDLQNMSFDDDVLESLRRIELKIISSGLTEECAKILDQLYFASHLFETIDIEVVGGQRKVEALLNFAVKAGRDISEVAAVGDSITDFKMLKDVRMRGGLAIAFNANEYCLPYADVAVATVDGRALIPLIKSFLEGGKEGAIELVADLESDLSALEDEFRYLIDIKSKPYFNLLDGSRKDFDDILRIHKKMRMKVRGEAGKLG